MQIRSCILHSFFRIQGSVKIKFGLMLLQLMTYISSFAFGTIANWQLAPGPFKISVKLQYNVIC